MPSDGDGLVLVLRHHHRAQFMGEISLQICQLDRVVVAASQHVIGGWGEADAPLTRFWVRLWISFFIKLLS